MSFVPLFCLHGTKIVFVPIKRKCVFWGAYTFHIQENRIEYLYINMSLITRGREQCKLFKIVVRKYSKQSIAKYLQITNSPQLGASSIILEYANASTVKREMFARNIRVKFNFHENSYSVLGFCCTTLLRLSIRNGGQISRLKRQWWTHYNDRPDPIILIVNGELSIDGYSSSITPTESVELSNHSVSRLGTAFRNISSSRKSEKKKRKRTKPLRDQERNPLGWLVIDRS